MAKKIPSKIPGATKDEHTASVFAGGEAGVDFIDLLHLEEVPPVLNDLQLARLSARLKAPVRMETHRDPRLSNKRSWLREIQIFNQEIRKLQTQQSERTGKAPPGRPAAPVRASKTEWVLQALVLLSDNPEWSDTQLAEAVGRDPGTLSRNKKFQDQAMEIRRISRRPGPVARSEGPRSLESKDNSLDLTRAASRQSQAEEDVDTSIDQEQRARKK